MPLDARPVRAGIMSTHVSNAAALVPSTAPPRATSEHHHRLRPGRASSGCLASPLSRWPPDEYSTGSCHAHGSAHQPPTGRPRPDPWERHAAGTTLTGPNSRSSSAIAFAMWWVLPYIDSKMIAVRITVSLSSGRPQGWAPSPCGTAVTTMGRRHLSIERDNHQSRRSGRAEHPEASPLRNAAVVDRHRFGGADLESRRYWPFVEMQDRGGCRGVWPT